MPYDENIPDANDLLSQSQADIQQNFAALKTLIDIDHETFGAANEGKHIQVTLPESAGDPAPAANEAIVYTKLSAVTGETGLFWQKENAGDVIEMTAYNQAASGYTLLPSGMKLCWGTGTINNGSVTSGAIVFNSAFTTATYSVQVTPTGYPGGAAQDSVLQVVGLTVAQFQVTRNNAYTGSGVNFSYIAIGI